VQAGVAGELEKALAIIKELNKLFRTVSPDYGGTLAWPLQRNLYGHFRFPNCALVRERETPTWEEFFEKNARYPHIRPPWRSFRDRGGQ
jgi:hypothetical protein